MYEKISLYLHVFDINIINEKSLLINSCKFQELVTENTFKDLVKNKIYFYNETESDLYENNTCNNSSVGTYSTLAQADTIIDKCIICDEFLEKLIKDPNDKLNLKEEELQQEQDEDEDNRHNSITDNTDNLCKCPYCSSKYHLICLARTAIANQLCLIPKTADCLVCGRDYIWSEFLK